MIGDHDRLTFMSQDPLDLVVLHPLCLSRYTQVRLWLSKLGGDISSVYDRVGIGFRLLPKLVGDTSQRSHAPRRA